MNNGIFLVYFTILLPLFFFTIPIGFGADSQLENEIEAPSDTNKIQSQVDELREKYAQEEQAELDRAQKDADTLVDQVKQRANEDVDAMPKFVTGQASYPAENADYAGNVDYIRQKEQARIKDIYDQLPKQQAIIRQTYEKKISGLISPEKNISDKGTYQLNPADTNLYVRNYSQTKLPPTSAVKTTKVVPESLTR